LYQWIGSVQSGHRYTNIFTLADITNIRYTYRSFTGSDLCDGSHVTCT